MPEEKNKDEKIVKVVSEDTIIKIKPAHLYTFLSVFVGILIAVFTFFYNMLNTQDANLDKKIEKMEKKVEERVEKKLYNNDKKYRDENSKEVSEDLESILTTVRNINEDVTKIKIKVGVMEHINNSNAPTTNNPPNMGAD